MVNSPGATLAAPNPAESPAPDPTLTRDARRLINTYARHSIVMERGEGAYLMDTAGRRYLDLMSGLGVNALGHAHPRLTAAIADQAGQLIHLSNFYSNRYTGQLAERLCELSGMSAVFFSNGGAEAIEGAMKLARGWGRQNFSHARHTFVALERSYHGRSFGAVSITGQPKYRELFGPGIGDVRFIPRNDIVALEAAMDQSVCAVLMEPLMGEGGVSECSPEFLQAARRAADRHNALLIFDEIQSGLGRTGEWFAFQRSGVQPDVLVIGKPLGGGLPLSAFLVGADKGLQQTLSVGQHGSTLGGSPLACRAGLEFLDTMEQEHLLAHIRDLGAVFQEELTAIVRDFPIAIETRGRGVIQALELSQPARPIVDAAIPLGYLLNTVQGNILRFLPPYIITAAQVRETMTMLRGLLEQAQRN